MSIHNNNSSKCFFNGFGLIFNFFPKVKLPERLNHDEKNGLNNDLAALEGDWKTIENDFIKVLKAYDNSTESSSD